MGEVVAFPGRTPSCHICEHAISGADGTYCRVFHEVILLESTAEDCPEFENDPFKH